MSMTKEQALHLQVKNRFVEYLKAAGFPYWEPALTICPHCGEHAGILMDFMWSCQYCGHRGDVVDYVMAQNHLETKMAAIKMICRTLHIKITELEVMSADELMDMQFTSTGMLIDQFIGKGVYLLAGAPKIGKSWLVLWLAHQVSRGAPVWEFETKKSDVLYISLEDPRHRIQQRLADVTGGETGNIWFATETELMGEGFEEQLTNFLREHKDVRFVIIDTLQKVRQMNANTYTYAGDYEVISHMKTIADNFDISILLVHHTRKSGSSDPFATISGTTGLSGGVDGSMVMLKPERQDSMATLNITGRDMLDQELQLEFDKTRKQWRLLQGSTNRKAEKRSVLLTAVYEFVTEQGDFHGSATELFALLSQKQELPIKQPNALSRMLNPATSILEQDYGIRYRNERTGEARKIHLERIPPPNDDSDDTAKDLTSPSLSSQ